MLLPFLAALVLSLILFKLGALAVTVFFLSVTVKVLLVAIVIGIVTAGLYLWRNRTESTEE